MSEVGDDYELARAYSLTSWYYTWAVWFRALKEKREEFGQKCLSYSKKALKLSEKIGDPHLISTSNFSAGIGALFYDVNPYSALEFFEGQQKHGAIAKDNYLIGSASMWISLVTYMIMTLLEEDPDKQREGFKKATKCAQDAIRQLLVIGEYSVLLMAYYSCTDSFTWSAFIETNLEAKRVLLERAVEVGREGLEHAEGSGCPVSTRHVFNALSNALYWLSNMETKVSEKRHLLEEALKYREKDINISQQLSPFDYWTRAGSQNHRALLEAELAKIETDKEKKRKLLEKAV